MIETPSPSAAPGGRGGPGPQQAVALLREGRVVVAPSDTHYTMVADPANPAATARIYQAKERDADFPLTLFLATPDLLDTVAVVTDEVRALAREVWPGFLTLIVPKRPEVVGAHVTAGLPTVAVACHRNPVLRTLLEGVGGYAACTSANLTGRGGELVTLEEAKAQVGDRVAAVLGGEPSTAGTGNTIVDLTGQRPVLVRHGEVPLPRIAQRLPGIEDRSARYKDDLKRRQQSVATWRPTLEGRTVLVTGAARGRGSELARVLALAGARVHVTDLDPGGAALAEELTEQGLTARFHTLDVTDPGAWQATVSDVLADGGRLDALINNAGYFEAGGLSDLSDDTWSLALRINTGGALHGIRAAAPVMGPGGSIVNVSSAFGLTASDLVGVAYQTSKGALLPLTRAAAVRLGGDGIRVNAVCPGLIRTPMTEPLFSDPATGDRIRAEVPLGREVSIWDIVDTVLFLVSPVSEYLTGVAVPVDGGLSAC
ncbi:SDR family oxidoreductase [Streptomyces sp. NPDC005931]|uniref:SDR family oxidoreductase n=1 Tax=Streptomyces sp. NPDC005931 TaxID=3364737 RepID=UPI0036970142